MGRQYGHLLKDQIHSYYQKAIIEHAPWETNATKQEAAIAFVTRYYANLPQRIKDIFDGMAETSGISVVDLTLLDQYTELFVLSGALHCSAFAAWGEYTTDGSAIVGKNEDMAEFFKEFDDSISVIVYGR